MTAPGTRILIDDVLMDPSRYFSHPGEVLEDVRLNREQKRRILRSWALDAELIDEAESENMRGRPEIVPNFAKHDWRFSNSTVE